MSNNIESAGFIMNTFTPGPWEAALDMDGRHQRVSILAKAPEFKKEDWPYHPLIAGAYHGRGQAPRGVCNANARLIAAAPEMYAALRKTCHLLGGGTFHDEILSIINRVDGLGLLGDAP